MMAKSMELVLQIQQGQSSHELPSHKKCMVWCAPIPKHLKTFGVLCFVYFCVAENNIFCGIGT